MPSMICCLVIQSLAVVAAAPPLEGAMPLSVAGPWSVQVGAGTVHLGGRDVTLPAAVELTVPPTDVVQVRDEANPNLPLFDENTFGSRLLGSIDLFLLWWIVNLAIGLGVLYKRRTAPIATTMLVVYGATALTMAVARSVWAGA